MTPLIPYFQIPVIHLGPLPVHGFGILVALGFIVGGNVAMKRANRVGLDGEHINRVLSWLILGTFVGGHVGYGLMYKPDEYLRNPIEFLKVWQGLSSFGGFLVCVPLAFWYFKKHRLPVWPYVDSLAIGLAIGWFFGRMGCTVAHDHPGTPANDFPLAIHCRPVQGHTLALPDFMVDQDHRQDLRWGPCRDDGELVTSITQQVDPATFDGVLAAHDVGFYEALWSLGVFLLFVVLDRWAWKPGFFVTLLGVLYGPVRFLLDSFRPPSTDPPWFVGTAIEMTPGQFWAIVFTVVALVGLVMRLTSADETYGPRKPWGARAEPEPAAAP